MVCVCVCCVVSVDHHQVDVTLDLKEELRGVWRVCRARTVLYFAVVEAVCLLTSNIESGHGSYGGEAGIRSPGPCSQRRDTGVSLILSTLQVTGIHTLALSLSALSTSFQHLTKEALPQHTFTHSTFIDYSGRHKAFALEFNAQVRIIHHFSAMSLVALAALPFAVGLGWVTLAYLVSRLCPYPTHKRICLLIAHCDDEAMFFSPTVIRLADPFLKNTVEILCLSNGKYNRGHRPRLTSPWIRS